MSKLSKEEARDKVFNDYLDNITKSVRKARTFYKTIVAELKEENRDVRESNHTLYLRCQKLEAKIESLEKDAAPFQNQIDQRKTYKGPDEQSQTE